MDAFLTPVVDTLGRFALDAALHYFYVFILVVIRMGGMMSTAPLFSQSVVPVSARVLIVLGFGFVLTPTIVETSGLNVARFDANRDGKLSLAELPHHMHGRVAHLIELRGLRAGEPLPIDAFASRFTLSDSGSELLKDVLCEFGVGFLLGLGVAVLMSGLQLAGQIVDQQLGLEFGQVINPDLQGGASVSSQMFFMLGGAVLLVMQPVNGHLMMIGALVETFDAMPVGEAVLFSGTHELFTELVHKSLLIGVQVAGPLLAAMSLVSVSLGFLGHSVPQINQMVVGFPIRSLAGMCVLLVTLTDSARLIVDAVPETIRHLQSALTSWS